MDSIYYKPSGNAPISGIIIALLGITAAAIVLSIVYVALQWFIPFIYINALFTIGLGGGIAGVGIKMLQKGKIRNVRVALIIGIAGSVVALYSQWALFISLKLASSDTALGGYIVKTSFSLNAYLDVLSNPKLVFKAIKMFNAAGTFSLKGTLVTGTFLWIIWIIEAAIILGGGCLMGFYVKNNPYSESCNEWMKERESKMLFVQDTVTLKNDLEAGKFKATLLPLKATPPSSNAYSEVSIYSLPQDNEAYISISNVTVTQDGKNEKKKSVNIIQLLRMPYSEAASL